MDHKERLTNIIEYSKEVGFVPIGLIGKTPVTVGWQKLTRETCFKPVYDCVLQGRCDNIGIVCGEASQIIVLDVDLKDGGMAYWKVLCDEHGEPVTFTVITGSGGLHYYFKYDDDTKVLRTSTKVINGKGIDIRSDKGQVVFINSIHPDTKDHYKLKTGVDDYNYPTISKMPQWLLSLILNNVRTPRVRTAQSTSRFLSAKLKEARIHKLTSGSRRSIQPVVTESTKPFVSVLDVQKVPQRSLGPISTVITSQNSSPSNSSETTIPQIPCPNDTLAVSEVKPFNSNNHPEFSEKHMRKVVTNLISLLSLERSTNYDLWTRGIWAIKSTSTNFLDLAHEFSKKCPDKYNPIVTNRKWDDGYTGIITLGTLLHWLNEDIDDYDYAKFKNKWLPTYNFLFRKYIDRLDNGLSRYAAKKLKNTVVAPNNSGNVCYNWNETGKIWETGKENILSKKMFKILCNLLESTLTHYKQVSSTLTKELRYMKADKSQHE